MNRLYSIVRVNSKLRFFGFFRRISFCLLLYSLLGLSLRYQRAYRLANYCVMVIVVSILFGAMLNIVLSSNGKYTHSPEQSIR